MNNAWPVAWRMSCHGLHNLSTSSTFRPLLRQIASITTRSRRPRLKLSSSIDPAFYGPIARSAHRPNVCERDIRSSIIASAAKASFATARGHPQAEDPPSTADDQLPRDLDVPFLSKSQIANAFGTRTLSSSPQFARHVLRVLQTRRINGTLDLELPEPIKQRVTAQEIDSGLHWLRSRYVVDEDAAILTRIEEEDRLEEKLWEEKIFKPQGRVEEAEDVHEEGVFAKMRRENRKRREREEAEKEQREKEALARLAEGGEHAPKGLTRWMVEMRQARLTDAQKDQLDVEERQNYISRDKWDEHYHDTSPEAKVMSKAQRILPSFIFTLVVLGISYYYAITYTPPSNSMMPDTPPAAATLFVMIAGNILIFSLWNFFPPAVTMMNKYFITIPGNPNALSLLGNVISHQQLSHLALNMAVLWIIGTRLHDSIGRGAFLSMYFSSGVLGAFASFSTLVLRNNLATTSLGASGAVAGVIACLLAVNADNAMVIRLLPEDWQEKCSFTGQTWFAALVLLELAGLFGRGMVKTRIDYFAHLGGYAAGWGWGKFLVGQGMVRGTGNTKRRDVDANATAAR